MTMRGIKFDTFAPVDLNKTLLTIQPFHALLTRSVISIQCELQCFLIKVRRVCDIEVGFCLPSFCLPFSVIDHVPLGCVPGLSSDNDRVAFHDPPNLTAVFLEGRSGFVPRIIPDSLPWLCLGVTCSRRHFDTLLGPDDSVVGLSI